MLVTLGDSPHRTEKIQSSADVKLLGKPAQVSHIKRGGNRTLECSAVVRTRGKHWLLRAGFLQMDSDITVVRFVEPDECDARRQVLSKRERQVGSSTAFRNVLSYLGLEPNLCRWTLGIVSVAICHCVLE